MRLGRINAVSELYEIDKHWSGSNMKHLLNIFGNSILSKPGKYSHTLLYSYVLGNKIKNKNYYYRNTLKSSCDLVKKTVEYWST